MFLETRAGERKRTKAQPGRLEEQQEIRERDITKAKEDLQRLKEEREAARKAPELLWNQTQSQLTVIKETLVKMIENDKLFTEKLNILFQERSITIAIIVTPFANFDYRTNSYRWPLEFCLCRCQIHGGVLAPP